MTRFALRGTIEERIIALHDEIAAGRVALSDDHFPAAAVRLLMPRNSAGAQLFP